MAMFKRILALFLLLSASKLVVAQDSLAKYSANVDSVLKLKNFYWSNLEYDSIYADVANRNKIELKNFANQKVQKSDFENQFESLLKYLENNGYPFAEIYFSDIQIADSNISAKLNLKLHDLVFVDSVRVISNNAIHPNYIKSYIQIQNGDIYRENLIMEIDAKINSLPFLKMKYQTQVYFVNKKAEIQIYPERVNANKFDGLIGVQPNGVNNKTSLVGQAQLYLVNTFKRGERMNLDFRAQPNLTRDLKINFNYPYLFNLPFGVEFDFNFRRQDSSFSIYSPEFALSYLFNAQNSIKFIYKIENSNLLSTKRFANITELPSVLDVNKFFYGASINLEKLDYRVNPSKGQKITFQVLLGRRTIQKNSAIEDSLYNAVQLKSNQIQFALAAQKFVKLYKKNIVMFGLRSAIIESDKILFNELYRLGGINDLRGFDEQSIFSSAYVIGTLEYRYLLDKNSFLRIFYDLSRIENSVNNLSLTASGIGAGMQVQTNAGILQLSYALGSVDKNVMSFQNGKIHFGIINYF